MAAIILNCRLTRTNTKRQKIKQNISIPKNTTHKYLANTQYEQQRNDFIHMDLLLSLRLSGFARLFRTT